MPEPLAIPPMVIKRPPMLSCSGDGFRTQVGRHDGPGCIRASTVAELSKKLRDAFDDSIDRQCTTNHAGRSDEDVLRGNSDVACKHGGSLLCGG